MRKAPPIGLSLAAIALGLLIAWVDSAPTWDDTGITAGMIFLTAAVFGAYAGALARRALAPPVRK